MASIPVKYRCKVGGEWKPLDAFSNNQQRFVQFQIDRRQRIDAANSGMTCKEHTSNQRTEMTCDLCGLTKPLNEFSGSSKRHGDTHCKRCTAWMETQEPDVVPAPLETGHISVEEERGEMWPTTFVDDTDFFSNDLVPQAPITGLSSLGLEDIDPSRLDMSVLSGRLAPSTSSSATRASDTLPPHLRNLIAQQQTASRGNDASEYAPSEADSHPSSMSTATTAREMRESNKPRRVSFNAWDPTGIQHRNIKSFTASSFAASSIRAPSDAGQGQGSSVEVSGRNNWPKHVRMTQSELRQVGTNHHIAAREITPVVKHRSQKHNFEAFCEPDDDEEDY
ncbi:Stc1 domain-containing protein [Trichoderma sp. SZMC 28014]